MNGSDVRIFLIGVCVGALAVLVCLAINIIIEVLSWKKKK